MPLSFSYHFTAGDLLRAVPLETNFQTIADKFNGGIVDADIAAAAAIQGSKLLANSLPADRLVNASLAAAQMSANLDLSAKLLAASIPASALTQTVGARITKAQMELTVDEKAFSGVTLPAGTGTPSAGTAVTPPTGTFAVASYDLIGLYIRTTSISGGTAAYIPSVEGTQSGGNWQATVKVEGNILSGAPAMAGTVVFVFLKKIL